jgi:tetratricopeptide (TPR) repeat protein
MLHKNTNLNLYESGVSAFIDKNYTASIEKFTQALEAGDESYHVWVSRGAAFLQSNKINRAVHDFSRAISIQPSRARAYHMRALAHDKLGDSEASLCDLDKALQLDPQYGAAYKSRAMVLDKIGRREEAVEDMRTAVELTELRLAEFNYENNIWQSHHLKLEADEVVSELER